MCTHRLKWTRRWKTTNASRPSWCELERYDVVAADFDELTLCSSGCPPSRPNASQESKYLQPSMSARCQGLRLVGMVRPDLAVGQDAEIMPYVLRRPIIALVDSSATAARYIA